MGAALMLPAGDSWQPNIRLLPLPSTTKALTVVPQGEPVRLFVIYEVRYGSLPQDCYYCDSEDDVLNAVRELVRDAKACRTPYRRQELTLNVRQIFTSYEDFLMLS